MELIFSLKDIFVSHFVKECFFLFRTEICKCVGHRIFVTFGKSISQLFIFNYFVEHGLERFLVLFRKFIECWDKVVLEDFQEHCCQLSNIFGASCVTLMFTFVNWLCEDWHLFLFLIIITVILNLSKVVKSNSVYFLRK